LPFVLNPIVEARGGLPHISQAYFGLFQYPTADGMRPIELAKRLRVSKQAMNHLLGQLKKLGFYLERCHERQTDTAVYLTEVDRRLLNPEVSRGRECQALASLLHRR
jgi:hypothetical protein